MVYEATSTLNQDDDILMFVKDSADSVEFGSIQLEKPPWANQPEIILELVNKKTSWNEHGFSASSGTALSRFLEKFRCQTLVFQPQFSIFALFMNAKDLTISAP